MKQIRISLLLAVLILIVAALGQGTASAAPGDTIYASPGQLVSVSGTRLNLYCMGRGSPTVVFDVGHQDWPPAWAIVQRRVAKWTRACSYDRAGAGFSDTGPMPRTSARIADELHSALQNAGVTGPYILVGYAFGGCNMRAFAYQHMPEVARLLLIDTDVGGVEPADMQEDTHRYFIRQAAELRECRNAVAEANPLAPDPASPGKPDLACDQWFFRGFPETAWSPELNTKLLRIARTRVALYDAVIAELQEMPGDEVYLQQHRRSFGSRPIRVLTASSHYSDTASTPSAIHLKHLQLEDEIAFSQARLLELSSNAKQVFAYQSRAAYIQLDEPDLVIEAIREVYDQSK